MMESLILVLSWPTDPEYPEDGPERMFGAVRDWLADQGVGVAALSMTIAPALVTEPEVGPPLVLVPTHARVDSIDPRAPFGWSPWRVGEIVALSEVTFDQLRYLQEITTPATIEHDGEQIIAVGVHYRGP